MDREEWVKEVKIALIRKGKTVSQMAREMEYTSAYIYATLGGNHPRQDMVDKISAYAGIEPIKL